MTKSSTFSPGVPVYGLTYDAEKGLLAAVGGGGSTKSGVKNRIVRCPEDSLDNFCSFCTSLKAPI